MTPRQRWAMGSMFLALVGTKALGYLLWPWWVVTLPLWAWAPLACAWVALLAVLRVLLVVLLALLGADR